jgi:hypothetical protein
MIFRTHIFRSGSSHLYGVKRGLRIVLLLDRVDLAQNLEWTRG